MLRSVTLSLMVLAFMSCTHKPVFSSYKAISNQSWDADSVVCFNVDIEDTTLAVQLILQVRHNDNYPYQNMWVFVDKTSPDHHTTTDTIEFYLADQRGRWLGSGAGNVRLMPVLIDEHYTFPVKGVYNFAVRHGMRTTQLQGIQDIGIEAYVKE